MPTLRCLTFLLLLFCALPASAQTDETPPTISDPYGRSTPRGTVDGYLKAMREADLTKAALFLDLSKQTQANGPRRAMQFKDLLDNGGFFILTDQLSSAPEGNVEDEMSADLEDVGALRAAGQEVPIILQRVKDDQGAFIWLVSIETVAELPALHRLSRESVLDRWLPDSLKATKVMTVPIGHWLAIILTALAAGIAGLFSARVGLKMLTWVLTIRLNVDDPPDVQQTSVPIGVIVGVFLYQSLVVDLGVQVVARGATDWIAVTILWLSFAVLALKIVDMTGDILRVVLKGKTQRTSLAALILMRKIVKAMILAVLVVQVLEVMGFDVTTALAALGVGGLALALGAQRTVENLVGSVIVVADRPVEVGDFCKFGDVSGTVEDIGIRSTQIRTPARTIVTVPNGAFASMQIENFSVRDTYLLNDVLSLRPDVDEAELRAILSDIRSELAARPDIAEGSRASLVALTRSSVDVEIFAHFEASNFNAFVTAREDLLLTFLRIVTRNGSMLAFPPQAIQLTPQRADL